MRQTKSPTAWWIGGAFAAACVLAAVVLAGFGAGERGTVVALRATARFSFLLFWLAYVGDGAAMLLGPALAPFKRHGREFGLAFASAQLVHAGLIAWLCRIGAAPGAGTFVFFGPPLVVVYVLALFSIRRLQQALGRAGWRVLRTVGMSYIAYAFAVDFVQVPFPVGAAHLVAYLPFAALSLAGPVLHCYPMAPSLGRRWTTPSRPSGR